MGGLRPPPTYSPRLQAYIDELRRRRESTEPEIKVSEYVAPPAGAAPEEPDQSLSTRVLSGLASLQHSLQANLRDLPLNLASPGKVGEDAARWMQQSPESWYRDPSLPPPEEIAGETPPPLVPAGELAKDAFVARPEAGDSTFVQNAKAAARGATGRIIDISTDPAGLAMIAATHGVSAVFPLVGTAANLGFGAMMAKSAYDEASRAYGLYREEGWSPAVSEAAAEAAVDTGLLLAPLVASGASRVARGRVGRELVDLGVPPENIGRMTLGEMRRVRDQLRGTEPRDPSDVPPLPPPGEPPPPPAAGGGREPYEPPGVGSTDLESRIRQFFGIPDTEVVPGTVVDTYLGIEGSADLPPRPRATAPRELGTGIAGPEPVPEPVPRDMGPAEEPPTVPPRPEAPPPPPGGGPEPATPGPPPPPPPTRPEGPGGATTTQRPAPPPRPMEDVAQELVAEALGGLDRDILAAQQRGNPQEVAALTKLRESLADASRETSRRPEDTPSPDPGLQELSDAQLVNFRGYLARMLEGLQQGGEGTEAHQRQIGFLIQSIDAQLRQTGRLYGPPAPTPTAEAPPPPAPAAPAAAPPSVPPGEGQPTGLRVPPPPAPAPPAPEEEQAPAEPAGEPIRGDIGRGPRGEGWIVRLYDRAGRVTGQQPAKTKAEAKNILKGAQPQLARNRRTERKTGLNEEEARIAATPPAEYPDQDSLEIAREMYAKGTKKLPKVLKALRAAAQLGHPIHPEWLKAFPLLKDIEPTGERTPYRGGELNPNMSPEERAQYLTGEKLPGADAVDRFFVSGLSRPKDIAAAAQMERPFGVDVGELSTRSVDEIAAAVGRMGANVFVDSGAFSLFRRNLKSPEGAPPAEPMDFGQVLDRYDEIVRRTGELADPEEYTHGRLSLVMPDVVGDQAASLAALEQHADRVRQLMAHPDVNAIVPLQKGELSLADMFNRAAEILGTKDFTVGLPGNAKAVSVEDVKQLRLAAGREIKGLHFLGVGPGNRLEELVRAWRRGEAGREFVPISADANLVRSLMEPGVSRAAAKAAAVGTTEAPPLEEPGLRELPATLQGLDPVQRYEYMAIVDSGIRAGADTSQALVDWAEENMAVAMSPEEAAWHLARYAKKPTPPEEEPTEAPPAPPVEAKPARPKKGKKKGARAKSVSRGTVPPRERDAFIAENGGDPALYREKTYKQNNYDPIRRLLRVFNGAKTLYPEATPYHEAIRQELLHLVRFYATEQTELQRSRERQGDRQAVIIETMPAAARALWDEHFAWEERARESDKTWRKEFDALWKDRDELLDKGVDSDILDHEEQSLNWAKTNREMAERGYVESDDALIEILTALGGFDNVGIWSTHELWNPDPEVQRKAAQHELIVEKVREAAETRIIRAGEGEDALEYEGNYVPRGLVAEIIANPPEPDPAVVAANIAEAKRRDEEMKAPRKKPRKAKPRAEKKPKPKDPIERILAKVSEDKRESARKYVTDLQRLEGQLWTKTEDAKGKGPGAKKARKERDELKLEVDGLYGGLQKAVGEGRANELQRAIRRAVKDKHVVKPSERAPSRFLPIVQRAVDAAVERLELDPVSFSEAVERAAQEITVPEEAVLSDLETEARRLLDMDARGEKEEVWAYNVVTKSYDRRKLVAIRWSLHFGNFPGVGAKGLKEALAKGPGHPVHAKILEYRTRREREGRAVEEALAEERPDLVVDADAQAGLEPIALALEEDLGERPEPEGRPALGGDAEGQFSDGSETHLLKTFMWGLKKPGTNESITTQEAVDAIKAGGGQLYARILHAYRDAVRSEGNEAGDVPFEVPEGEMDAGESPVESRTRGYTSAKTYHEQAYAWAVPVKVTFPDGSIHYDAVKGLNPGHALYLARENWPNAARVEVDELGLGLEDPGPGFFEAPRPLGGRYGPRPVRPTQKQIELFDRPQKPVDRPAAPQYPRPHGPAAAGGPRRSGTEPRRPAGAGSRPGEPAQPAGGREAGAPGAQPPGVVFAGGVPAPAGAAPRAGIFQILTVRPEATFARPPDYELIPADLRPHLGPEQQLGAAKAVEVMDRGEGFLLADGTGVGKTREILAVASRFARQGKPVLIVAPSEVMKPKQRGGQWRISGSYVEDGAAMGVSVNFMPSNERGPLRAGVISISTYHNLDKHQVTPETVLLFDESHQLKRSEEAARGRAGFRQAATAGSVMFATATPGDKPSHLVYLDRIGIREGKPLDQFMKDLGMVASTVKVKIKDPATGRAKEVEKRIWVFGASKKRTYKLMEELFERLTRKGNIVRREIDMRGLDIQFRDITLGEATREKMERLANARFANRAVMLQHQRRQQEPDKLPLAQKLISEELAAGRSVVLFASRVNFSKAVVKHKVYGYNGEAVDEVEEVIAESEGTLKQLREWLAAEDIPYAEVHGAAEGGADAEMARFQRGEATVMIATPESGGTGINLDDRVGDRPRTMIVLTAPFDSISNVQMVGRIHRVTTKSQGRVIYLFSEQDVDDWNKAIIATKMKMLGAQVSGNVALLDPDELSEFGDPDQPNMGQDAKDQGPPAHSLEAMLGAIIRGRGQAVVSLKQFRFLRRRLQHLRAIFEERHEHYGKYGDFKIYTSDGQEFRGRLIPPDPNPAGEQGYATWAGPGQELVEPKKVTPAPPGTAARLPSRQGIYDQMVALAPEYSTYRGQKRAKPIVSQKQSRFIHDRLTKLGASFFGNQFRIATDDGEISGVFEPFQPATETRIEQRGRLQWTPFGGYVESPRRMRYGTRAAMRLDELIATLDEHKDWRDFHSRHYRTIVSLFGKDADLFRALLGITSQAADVRANVALAVKAYRQIRLGEPFDGYLPAVRRNLERLASSDGVRGQKIRPYTRASLGLDDIAVDRHVARLVLGRENLKQGASPNATQVNFVRELLRQAADELGWSGDEAASAAWAAQQLTNDEIPPDEVMTYDRVLQTHAAAIRRFRAYFGDVAGPGGRVHFALSTLEASHRDPFERFGAELGHDDPETVRNAELALDFVERLVGPPGQFRPYRVGTGTALDDGTPDELGVEWVGGALREAFFEEGGFDLVGKPARSIDEVGVITQLLRNPAFETTYILPVKEGRVLASWAETLRLPTASLGAPNVAQWSQWSADVRERLAGLGAEGFYVTHNHPSGDPEPSQADWEMTGVFQHLFGELFLGHVVTDHGSFAAIDPQDPKVKTVLDKLAAWELVKQLSYEGYEFPEEERADVQRVRQSRDVALLGLEFVNEEIRKAIPPIRDSHDAFLQRDVDSGEYHERFRTTIRGILLSRGIHTPRRLAEAGSQFLLDPARAQGSPFLFFLSEGRVATVGAVPVELFTDRDAFLPWATEQMRATGADTLVAVVPPEATELRGKSGVTVTNAARHYTRAGALDDALVDGQAIAQTPRWIGGNTLMSLVRERAAMRRGMSGYFLESSGRRRYRPGAPEPAKADGMATGAGAGDDPRKPPPPFMWPDDEGPGTPWWDRRVAYARARSRARLRTAAMGFDPHWFWDAVVLGADAIGRGIRSFNRWLIAMSGDIRNRGVLQSAWEYLQGILRPQYRETVRHGTVGDVPEVETVEPGRKVVRPIPKPTERDAREMLSWLEHMMTPDPGTGKPPEFNWKGERIGLSTNITRIADEGGVRDFITRAAYALEQRFGKARSYRSWAEARRLALELGWTEGDFIRALKEKGALTDYEITAGRILRQEASLDFLNKHQAYRDAARDVAEAKSEPERAARQQTLLETEREMNAALQKAIGVQYATVAAGSEAGRALAAHRMWIESLTPEERFLQRMMRGRRPDDALIQQLAEALMKRDRAAFDRLVRTINKPTMLDRLLEYWINSILSGPATPAANVMGNWLHEALLRTPERGLASVLEQRGIRARIERFLTGRAAPQERVPGEMMEAARALVKYRFGLISALKGALKATTNEDVGFGIKGEYRPPAIGGTLGKIVRTPGRWMEALDIGAKYAAAAAERAAQTLRMAVTEAQREGGWTQDRVQGRMEEIHRSLDRYLELDSRRKLNPRDVSKEDMSFLLRNRSTLGEIAAAMEKAANESTFRDETTRFAKYLQLLRAQYPWLTFVIPFIRTPERILVQAVRRTPVGLAKTLMNVRSGKLSGGEASDRIAQGLLGTAVTAGVYMMAKGGVITGGGPADWDERRNWLATGKQPYAVKIGDTWVSLARIEPLATTLGFAADLAEATDEKIAGDVWDKLHYSIINNIANKTYLEGLVSAAEAVGDPDRYGARFYKRTVGALVPNLLATAARAVDPTIRETDDIKSTLMARVPWFSQQLPAKLTGTGEPIQRGEDPFSRFASPFRYSVEAGPEKNLERLFLETGYSPGAPPKSMSMPGTMGRHVMLTPEERQIYAAYAERASAFARNLTSNADWEPLDVYAKTELLKRIYRFAHDAARRAIYRNILRRVQAGQYELKER